MRIVETEIPGCFEIHPAVVVDQRGTFVKTFHAPSFAEAGLETEFVEAYHSRSRQGVLRGLHFQLPPHDHAKLVYCSDGIVLDAVVDLRVGSPTFGRHRLSELSAGQANALYVPPGLAHGFCVVDGEAVIHYQVSTVFRPEHDTGIHWDSAGIPWPVKNPVVSERDMSFAGLDEYQSPFVYGGAAK